MNELKKKKNLIKFLVVIILIAGLGIGIYLVRQQQVFKGRAVGGIVEFFKCTSCSQIVSLTGAVTQGFTLNSRGEAEVGLRLTSPFGQPAPLQSPAPTSSTATPTPTSISTSAPTSTPILSPTRAPTPTSVSQVDADGDGYPAGVDCYDQNPNAKPGQYQFFTTDRGDGSFDYDCDGVIFRGGILGQQTSLPAAGCYPAKPSGEMGWVGSSPPACGQTGVSRRCNSYSANSCSGQESVSGTLTCVANASSWIIRETTISPVTCR